MTVTHLTPGDYRTSRWSGGATTELLILPRGAAYGQRDFLCRISSATVELDASTFTALPDYDRLIATVEGTISLTHDGGEPLTLAPYQVHAFDGGSNTLSQGRCRDFNLMLRKGKATGSLTPLAAPCALTLAAPIALLYCAEGACAVALGKEAYDLQAGDSLLLEEACGATITLQGDCRLMLAQVKETED